tara:strand:- start:933 stop:1235 length:303 start_codon:yes stop_codon:yes gene_type:complete
MKITKRQLRRIIQEEKSKLLSESEQESAWEFTDNDELRQLGMAISEMVVQSREVELLMHDMGMHYGELVALGTNARTIKNLVKELEDKYNNKLDDILRFG